MPPRVLSPVPGFGAGTRCQPLPVLRATKVCCRPVAASRYSPTSHTVLPATATPLTSENPVPRPLGCVAVQVPPLRCSISGNPWWVASSLWPTAHTSPPLLTATAWSSPPVSPADGTLTTLQERPFQCSTSGVSEVASLRWPTAHTSSGPAAAMPYSWLLNFPGFGLGTTDHRLPL